MKCVCPLIEVTVRNQAIVAYFRAPSRNLSCATPRTNVLEISI